MIGPMVQWLVQWLNGQSNAPMLQWLVQCSVQWSNDRSNGSMVSPMVQVLQRSTARTCVRSTAHVCADVPDPPRGALHTWVHTYKTLENAGTTTTFYIRLHTYVHTYEHTCLHTYIHTYIHTQWCQPAPLLAHVPAPSVLFEKKVMISLVGSVTKLALL